MIHYDFQAPPLELTDSHRAQRKELALLAETVLNASVFTPDAAKYENRPSDPYSFVRSARILVPRVASEPDSWIGVREERSYSFRHDQMWPSVEIWGKGVEYHLNIGKPDSITVFNPHRPHHTEDRNTYTMNPNTDYFAAHLLIVGALRLADNRLRVTRRPGLARTLEYTMGRAHHRSEPGKFVRFASSTY